MSRSLGLLLYLSLFSTSAQAVTLASVLNAYNLNVATFNYSLPSTTLNSADANSWIGDNWDLYRGKVDFGDSDIVFSADPSTSSSTLVKRADSTTSKTSTSTTKTTTSTSTSTSSISYPATTSLGGKPPVLRVNYPAGSYSKSTGGTQFYSEPLNSTTNDAYQRMLLSYDIWVPTGFAWNMGGKLPGLRGGPDPRGCSGGTQTNGTTCFSTRLMWRASGAAEVYAYIPTTQSNFCSASNVICNSDYGTSLSRGSFTLATGQWQTIWLVVILNTVGTANGVVQLYYNGVQAMSFTNLEIRSSSSIASIGGLYFSTFFGGDDSSWASPTSQYTYFKNIQLYAGTGQSNATGVSTTTSGAGLVSGVGSGWWAILAALVGMVGLLA